MIPQEAEFLIPCVCPACGQEINHFCNFVAWDCTRSLVEISLECDICCNEQFIVLEQENYEEIQPPEIRFHNAN